MGIGGRLVDGIDGFIGIFSPQRALIRKLHRERLRSAQYAAAKTSRLTGAWSPADASINDVLGTSNDKIRARVRQLVRDFPFFASAVDRVCENVVGDGIRFQSRILSPDGKSIDKRRIQQTEDFFSFWADDCDVAGRLHFYEMMELAKRQEFEGGEFLIAQVFDPNAKFIPYKLQMLESDWLASSATSNVAKSNTFDQGIEYNPATGRVVAYHFTDPDSWGKTQRVASENVIHGFKSLRPGQRRGVSALAPAVLVAHDLSDLMDAAIDSAKLAEKYLAFVETPDPLTRTSPMDTDDDGKTIDEMENAIVEYLRPGEKVTFATNPGFSDKNAGFVKLILQMIAVTAPIPYEILSGNYQGLNYSTGKMVRNDYSKALRPQHTRHIRHFCEPIKVGAIKAGVMAGKLSYPSFFSNPGRWLRAEWQPPGSESIDPLRETKSRIDEVKEGLRSQFEIIKSRGRDAEDVVKEIAAFQRLCEDNGIKLESVSTATPNNPAAVEGQKADIVDIMDKLDELISA